MIQNIAEECSTFQSKALVCPFIYVCNQGICIPRSSIGKAYALTKMNRILGCFIVCFVAGCQHRNDLHILIESKQTVHHHSLYTTGKCIGSIHRIHGGKVYSYHCRNIRILGYRLACRNRDGILRTCF